MSDGSWAEALRIDNDRWLTGERGRPSVLFQPRLYRDGNKWCALLGSDLMSGVVGFGDSPDEAMRNFDLAWTTKVTEETTNRGGA